MIERNGVALEFHHMGIPTDAERPGEQYSEVAGMYTSDSPCRLLRVNWHRFDETSQLHPLIRTVPHAAFKVADLERAIEGATLLLGPYEPIAGYRVAIIEDGGIPIEMIQTALSDEEIWSRAASDNRLYADGAAKEEMARAFRRSADKAAGAG